MGRSTDNMKRTMALILATAVSLVGLMGLLVASFTGVNASCLGAGYSAGPGWDKGSDGCWHPPGQKNGASGGYVGGIGGSGHSDKTSPPFHPNETFNHYGATKHTEE